jgi:hypothetical protein
MKMQIPKINVMPTCLRRIGMKISDVVFESMFDQIAKVLVRIDGNDTESLSPVKIGVVSIAAANIEYQVIVHGNSKALARGHTLISNAR